MTTSRINKSETGLIGEILAKKFLRKKGYTIIEQNFRTKYSEMDLVVKKKDVLVFVEVRTKTSEYFGSPEETINKHKINRLVRSAQAYISYNQYSGNARIDAICIVLNPDASPNRITHYESITL
ncbi:MAG: YraN family protein [Candidatus Omnitrophica bacterium]|nr:YraN family protein [Candidatus Omnitrophota bacterium]